MDNRQKVTMALGECIVDTQKDKPEFGLEGMMNKTFDDVILAFSMLSEKIRRVPMGLLVEAGIAKDEEAMKKLEDYLGEMTEEDMEEISKGFELAMSFLGE